MTTSNLAKQKFVEQNFETLTGFLLEKERQILKLKMDGFTHQEISIKMNISEKTGNLVAIKNVDDTNDLMIINKSGIIIRLSVVNLRVMGRATQGVRLINIKGSDSIAAVAKVMHENENEEELEEYDLRCNTDTERRNRACAHPAAILAQTEDDVVKALIDVVTSHRNM